MGPRFVILNAGAEHALVCIFIVTECVFVLLVASTQYNHLRVAVHDLGNDGVDQVQALLVRQAGDQANNKLASILP